MDRTLFNMCCRRTILRTAIQNQSCLPLLRNGRAIHISAVRAAKSTKSSPKKARKQQPLEYRPPTRKSNITSHSLPKPKENPLRFRTIPIVGASVFLFTMAGYMGYIYYQSIKPDPDPSSISTGDFAAQADVSAQYEKIAQSFDSSVDATEYTMGIASLRRKLVSEAKGDVLEVSIGTGRNMEFYDWNFKGDTKRGKTKEGKVRSLTAVDKSGEMLEIAHEKFCNMFPGILGIRWVIADASELGKIPGPPKNANERSGSVERKYDTVIQTFGLCSVSDPVGLLRVLGDCVKEDEGRILLLEHGRGRWGWLNSILDKGAERHAKEFGCWWNRDMEDIVEKSGLEVVNIYSKWWHGGTTWWIELKKPKSEVIVKEKKVEQGTQKPPEPSSAVVSSQKVEDDAQQSSPGPVSVKKGWW
ncbi:S-adenosyl-L-methionine-dependent methyltransferase [Mollisia scopiformis]|uniref:S-adenosyl-L-methionine-dependent methyltransferase n=1 Tax=Mollisia scopiformis TaxID=149040 RepID=A0A194XJQ3_MOLSC|nr:S-adenosyl-L-methionine-dependent methyltransferase [Mollisia scopiformis]KUJ20465.1 S-adenosyl-L-methionine-dependent methyltransferase [Mollisia scopiformis]